MMVGKSGDFSSSFVLDLVQFNLLKGLLLPQHPIGSHHPSFPQFEDRSEGFPAERAILLSFLRHKQHHTFTQLARH